MIHGRVKRYRKACESSSYPIELKSNFAKPTETSLEGIEEFSFK